MKSFKFIKLKPALVVLLVLIALGVWFLRVYDSSAAHLNRVILISIDTCRADHLSCYGYHRRTTPNIDAIAQEGVLFENAVSPVPTTLPAHASMLTGTIPAYHGIHDNDGYKLDSSYLTLAEILTQAGFTTGAVVSAFVLDSQFGLDQGFESYNDKFEEELEGNLIVQRRGGEVNRFALDWLTRHRKEKFFLFLHYYDPHAKYEPPEPFFSLYRDSLYAGEVAYTDYCIGQVIEKLKRLRLYDSSLIIITSDHGEMLGEHKELTHGYFIYQGAVKVPLIFKLPAQTRPRRIRSPVGLVDIVPTACGLLGLDVPAGLQGKDLSPYFRENPPPAAERRLYCESFTPTKYDANPLFGIVTGRFKYIHATKPELYDLINDPSESDNLAERLPEQAHNLQVHLKKTLERTVSRREHDSRLEMSQEDIKRLESLGYVAGGKVREQFELDQGKDDPKDLIDFHLEYGKISSLLLEGKYEEAKAICEKLLSQRPGLARVYHRLGDIAFEQEDIAAAAGYFGKAVEFEPRGMEAHISQRSLGTLLALLDRDDEAIVHYEQSLQIQPNQPMVLDNLARLYFRRHKLRQAYDCWNRVLDFEDDWPDVLNNLAWLKAVYENEPFYNLDEAIEMAERACEMTDYKKYQMLDTLGVAYAAAGRFKEAIKTSELALKLARAEEEDETGAQTVQQHLELFKAGRPYREQVQPEGAAGQ
jgi:arylsulfatase A-like enzyme/Flp pilus assembly protein TadD